MSVERGICQGRDNISNLYNGFCTGSPDATFGVFYTARDKYFEPPRGMTKEERADFFESFLARLEEQNDNSLYYLRIYEKPSKGPVDTKTEYLVSMPFRVVELSTEQKELGMYNGVPAYLGLNKSIDSKFDKLAELIEAQQVQIKALLDQESEDEPIAIKPKGLAGVISGMMENEQLMAAVVAQVGPVLQKIVGSILSPQYPQQRSPVLNGMTEKETLNFDFPKSEEIDLQLLDETLSRLSKHFSLNTDLPKLADYLDKNPDKAKFIMSFIS